MPRILFRVHGLIDPRRQRAGQPHLAERCGLHQCLPFIGAIIGELLVRMAALPNLQVRDLALSYYKAAEVLADADANAIPIINLRCHAIELFLKSLHLKDSATDIGDGVFLLRPDSGRSSSQDLKGSFEKALQGHRDELLSNIPTLLDDLENLKGVFQRSRYLYENGHSLPFLEATRVSQYLAEKLPLLPLLVVSID